MKSKLLKITMILILIMSLLQVGVNAELGEVTTTVKTQKDTYKVGDKIEVTIDWGKEVQALGMKITYNKDTLKFDSTTVGSNYYNADTAGEILYNWFSATDEKLTKSTFTFVAIAEGKATIATDVQEYSDEELNPATGYINVPKEIKIEKEGTQPGENPGQKPEVKPEPEAVTLKSIAITKTPTKNTYRAGEKFETAGMEITAKYSDGTTKVVKNYTYSPNGVLKATDKKVVISYTENGVTKVVEQKITMIDGKGEGSGENNNNSTDKKPVEDNTTAPGKISQAGLETTGIMAIVVLAIIAVVGLKGYKKLEDI